jgi:hypothetical protein
MALKLRSLWFKLRCLWATLMGYQLGGYTITYFKDEDYAAAMNEARTIRKDTGMPVNVIKMDEIL